jgi:hypothetical protein
MKFFLALLLLVTWGWRPLASNAQVTDFVTFTNLEHDFGVRKEEEKELKHEFTFKNTGKVPVKLTYVKASCGCTTPSWTKDEIKPGGTGSVTATFGAAGRPGKFDKAITVRASTLDNIDEAGNDKDQAKSQTVILKIKGEVTPKAIPDQPVHDRHSHDGHNHDGHNHQHGGHDHSHDGHKH